MIVPFIFEIIYYDSQYPLYSWILYRLLTCLNHTYMITQENHLGPMTSDRKSYFLRHSKDMEYRFPSKEQLEKLKQWCVTNDETERLLEKYSSRYEAARTIIKKRDVNLERILEDRIAKIEKQTSKKIEVLLCWVGLKSVYEVAKKHHIKVIVMELSSIRRPHYNTTLGHFSFQDKYDKRGAFHDYQQFLREYKDNPIPILNRKELLSLFLPTQKLNLIEQKDNIEEFEIGISPGIKEDFFFDNFSKMSLSKVLYRVEHLFQENEISIRFHPDYVWDLDIRNWSMDFSPTSYEWILRCKRIISFVSNVGFEAMLFGKTSYIMSDYLPFSFMAITDLDYIEDTVVDLKFLNYMLFSYYVPWELMYDENYIKWRLTNPSPMKRYQYHTDYLKQKYHIRGEWNLDVILTKVHNLKSNEIEKYKNMSVANLYKTERRLDQKLKEATEQNDRYRRELDQILNSTSWKITKPLRSMARLWKRSR